MGSAQFLERRHRPTVIPRSPVLRTLVRIGAAMHFESVTIQGDHNCDEADFVRLCPREIVTTRAALVAVREVESKDYFFRRIFSSSWAIRD
jgi:hypothetical protein